MAKNTPAWILMGLPEQPPVDATGYVNYGTVWSADMPSQREPLYHDIYWALWSWSHWGRKVRQEVANAHAEGIKLWWHPGALAVVWTWDRLFRLAVTLKGDLQVQG